LEEILSKATQIRVLMLMQWFEPEPTIKGLVFARELVRHGFDVEVVTGFPNYPGGKLYPGYKIRWIQREQIDGVNITRLPLYPNHDQSVIKRILNYVSFAVSILFYGLFIAKRADVMYAYHPPLTVGIAACLIRGFRRIPLVYDIQDMWPDTLRATGMLKNSRLLRLIERLCEWVYRHVDQIVVLSPGFKNLLVKRGVPECKIKVIYNWADESSLMYSKSKLPPDLPGENQFRIIFAGNIGKAQGLEVVLEAAEILRERSSRVIFIMLGSGLEVNRLKLRRQDLALGNVIFLPSVPMSEVVSYLTIADALLVHLRNDPLFEITIPSKTQAYMAIGKPILMAVSGDAADLVKKSNSGLILESENPEALANSAEQLAKMSSSNLQAMGGRARRYYQKQLSLQVGVRSFRSIFKTLANKVNE
jgi:colanic acid biosynthesis glycosyl transferase WcaI